MLQKIKLRPGVNREGTSLSNEGGWFECDKIRFRSGYPEKIGGWAALTYTKFFGSARSLWNWVTLSGFNLLGIGTSSKFYVENGGAYYDITPVRYTTPAGGISFTAQNGSATITVTAEIGSIGFVNGDCIVFSGAVSLGGNITAAILNQEYQITYVSSLVFTIQARAVSDVANPGAAVLANGSDTGNGGGATVGTFLLSVGSSAFTTGPGYGVGLYGGYLDGQALNALNGSINAVVTTITVTSTTGFTATGAILIDSEYITYTGKTPTTFTGCTRGQDDTTAATHASLAAVSQSTDFVGYGESPPASSVTQLRLWSQINYGENLIFCVRGAALYFWDGSGAPPTYATRGTVISGTDIPANVLAVTMSDATRILIAFGCNDYGGYGATPIDPLLIRWSASENYLDWTPSALNQAGSYRLSHGSSISTYLQTRQEILVWTDAALYSMQYVGAPFVWSFNILTDNVSLISPNAVATSNGVVYWMGIDKFYVYTGRTETLPSTLRQYVYNDLNMAQSSQFFAGTNEGFSEIWWFYCSASSDVIDRYVIFNYLDRVWYYGTMGRTAWLDTSVRQYPIAATLDSTLMYHEADIDNGETNPPSAISSYIQSSDFDIGDGHNYGFVWRMIPDITFDGSTTASPGYPSVTFAVRPKQNPGANYGPASTPTVTSTISYNSQHTYNVQQFTEIVYTRVRGRQMAFKVSCDTLGSQWQLGSPAADVRPDGRR